MTTKRRAVEVLEMFKADGYTLDDLIELMRQLENLPVAKGSAKKKMSDAEADDMALKKRVTGLLQKLGFLVNHKGYQYVRAALIKGYKDPSLLEHITKGLYPELAKEFNTTPIRVERNMRLAIEAAWNRSQFEILHPYFGHTYNFDRNKPTNSEFIAKIVDKFLTEDGK